jgi:isopenicillin-N N-acyltransferase like protein
MVPLVMVAATAQSAPPADPSLPFPIVELRGDPAELGMQHGQALGEAIRSLNEKYLRRMVGANFDRAAQGAMAFAPLMSADHVTEVKAMAAGARLDVREMMLAQCFLDLDSMAACSTVTLPASAAPDGVARFARNLDFPSLGVADKGSVVLVFHPKDRNAFIAVTWPGLIGALSGMNEHGLTLASMEVTRGRRAPSAMPYMLLYRTVLEQCRTVDEAIALLDKTPKQTANNLMLMDAAGARAVVEITPEKIAVRRADDRRALASTNHHRGEDMDTRGRCFRYDTLIATSDAKFGNVGVSELEALLKAVQQGDETIQSMIFEPANRVMYLSTGARSASRPFHKINLNSYFAGRAVAPAPAPTGNSKVKAP